MTNSENVLVEMISALKSEKESVKDEDTVDSIMDIINKKKQ